LLPGLSPGSGSSSASCLWVWFPESRQSVRLASPEHTGACVPGRVESPRANRSRRRARAGATLWRQRVRAAGIGSLWEIQAGRGRKPQYAQCVSLLLSILGLASPAGLNLPERTDPGGAHALAPQGSGMAIDVIGGSNFQVLLAGGRRQDQAAAQGHLLRRAGRRFPPDHLRQIVGG